MSVKTRLQRPGRNLPRLSLAALACAFLTGCASHSATGARQALRAGDSREALKWACELQTSRFSKELGALEAGRIHMLVGDFANSQTHLDTAIETVMAKNETEPVINLGDLAWTGLAATFTDDTVRPYRIPPYEFILALTYQMWNYIFMGRPDSARVEARRAVFAQDAFAEKYGPAAQTGSSGMTGHNAKAMSAMDSEMAGMAPVLELTRSSHENGLAWWFCGILFELDGDASNARLAYQKAWELVPDNPHFERDMLRVFRTEWPEKFEELIEQSNIPAESLGRSGAEIVLVVEEGFVSQRESVKIPIPLIGTTATSVDFPMYRDAFYQPLALSLSTGETRGELSPALYVQSLAYRDLKDKMPGIVARNVIRILTRIGGQQTANFAGGGGMHSHMGSGASIGVGMFNLASAILNKADTRAWYMLPMVAHVYRGNIEPGEHTLVLAANRGYYGRTVSFPVTIGEGETRLVWVADIGGQSHAVSAPMNENGGPAAREEINSLLQQ